MSIPSSIIDMGFLESDADAILALPSGMVAVSECKVIHNKSLLDGIKNPCPHCHGTGRIERDISIQEVVEWIRNQIVSDNTCKDNFVRYKLPSGERVEVKK